MSRADRPRDPDRGEPVVRAAGGLVVRRGEHGPEVLVVHRPRYDDWSLPKGTRDGDEDDATTALREVAEETGVGAALGSELPTAEYRDRRGRPKRVRFWRMSVVRDEGFRPSDEVDEIRWLSPSDAMRLLSYDHDRRLVEALEVRGVSVYVVRHARARNRMAWEGDDRLRPLTKRGRRQAEAIAHLLAAEEFTSIVSSPYVRCLETVVPLAACRTMPIDVDEALAEGASLPAVLSLVDKHADAGAVLCTHGDVVPLLVGHARAHGVDVGEDPCWPKGSIWVLDLRAGEVVAARYVPPPPGD